jgi:hypothetical protein
LTGDCRASLSVFLFSPALPAARLGNGANMEQKTKMGGFKSASHFHLQLANNGY